MTGSGVAFLEIRAPRASFHAGEPIHVTLRFGFDEAFFTTNLVPLFRVPLEIPVQVAAPWIDDLPGATVRATPSDAAPGAARFSLNETVAAARRVDDANVGGARQRVFELERTYFARGAGDLELPAARLRFAYGTRFGEHLLGDAAALDRAEGFVESAPRTLAILPLPEEGRPQSFTGAVGRFTLRTEVLPREIDEGGSVRLLLHVEGDGNFEAFDAPRLASTESWRVLGTLEAESAEGRTLEYDLAPSSARATRVPQIAFAYFDTTPPASYRTLESEASSVVVRARQAAPEGGGAPAPPRLPSKSSGGAGVIVVVLAVVLAAARRRQQRRK